MSVSLSPKSHDHDTTLPSPSLDVSVNVHSRSVHNDENPATGSTFPPLDPPPSTTSPYGWGPNGILNPVTVTVQVPATADETYTFSTLFTLSAEPPVADQPAEKTLPV